MTPLEYGLEIEWSLGSGQCPQCCGVPEGWLGHPCYLTPETLGHKRDCKLASCIKQLGGSVLYLGESTRTERFRVVIGGDGSRTVHENEPYTQKEIENQKRMNLELIKIWESNDT